MFMKGFTVCCGDHGECLFSEQGEKGQGLSCGKEVMSDLFLGERGWDIVATVQMGYYKGLK